MSDTSGLPNTDAEGVPAEDRPERFESGSGADGAGAQGDGRDAQAAEPAETEPVETEPVDTEAGQEGSGSQGDGRDAQAAEPAETEAGQEGAEDVTPPPSPASTGDRGSEPPPADFDPAQQPSNPDMVKSTEPPD